VKYVQIPYDKRDTRYRTARGVCCVCGQGPGWHTLDCAVWRTMCATRTTAPEVANYRTDPNRFLRAAERPDMPAPVDPETLSEWAAGVPPSLPEGDRLILHALGVRW